MSMTAADRPSVTDNARAVREAAISLYRAMRRANPDAWAEVDEVEDWAYWDDIVRTAQVALAAGRAETTTATTEDALDSLPYFTFEDDDVAPDEEFVRKADVARLLATARTLPTREELIDALVMSPLSDTAGTDMRPFEQTADAVLALLRDGAR